MCGLSKGASNLHMHAEAYAKQNVSAIQTDPDMYI